ncbi:fatty acyl-AMP ligase [Pendulispora albinea]|uniref:Fatty acyl-AMP ligase n=1 Tax=Pendulispora albinea TaxID=2741071 RepID=A0ABZ2LKP1_9BACT
MDYRPRFVAPTLVEAVRSLSGDEQRGFVFVRPDGQERFCSFAEIHREATRRGAHLAARGLAKGDRVALVIPDSDEFVLSFLGAIYAGVVPVPMYPQLSFKNVESYHDTVAHITRASGASLLLTTATTRPFVEPVKDKVETLGSIVSVSELEGPAPGSIDHVKISPTDHCFFQFTSGSTSRPKGVVVTHGNLAANSEAIMIHGLAKDSSVDKGVSWLPLFHDMGLIGFVIAPLFTDIPVVFLPTASFVRAPRLWLDAIHKHRGTITYAPNFAYALVAKRLKDKDVAGLDLSCVKIAGCGAEPIQAKTLRDFAEKVKPAKFDPRAFLPSYGMAEATLAITFVEHLTGAHSDTVDPKALQEGKASPASNGGQELVCCGHAFPDHEIAIVDEHGRRLGDREVGEIIARGPSITLGYYQEPELTAQSWKPYDGETWLHTGDLGYTVDGQVYICGRIKDIIIIRGRNYYPQDIEWAVSELPGIRRGNVVAFSVDVDGEEQLVICAEAFQSDAVGLIEQITSTVAGQIGLSVHKVEIVPQGSLPRTSSGKPQRRKTKQMFEAGTLPSARATRAGQSDQDAQDAQENV